jgi:membrane-associated protein
MNMLMKVVDFILHIDQYLKIIIPQFGPWTYGLLFFVIFMETGFVVTPFLPGDSLLFAAATFAANTSGGHAVLNPWILFILMTIAAFAGDTANYWIGHAIGAKAYTGEVKWIKKEYMERTHAFFEKHGGKAIFLARFVPIIRTFTPFIAGVSEMPYGYFIRWNLIGGATWVGTFTLLGYAFGNIRFVQNNFELVIVAIILISLIPVLVEAIKARKEAKRKNIELNS